MVHFFLFYFWGFLFFWRGGVWWCCILYPLPFSKFQFKMIMVYMYVMYLCVKMMGYDYTELTCCRCLIPSHSLHPDLYDIIILYHLQWQIIRNQHRGDCCSFHHLYSCRAASKLTLKTQKKEISISVHFLQYFEMLQMVWPLELQRFEVYEETFWRKISENCQFLTFSCSVT